MSGLRYLGGWLLLAVWSAPLTVAAVLLRRRFAATWTGATARLAEAVLVLAALLGAAQLVGTVGQLRAGPMTAACFVLAGFGVLAARRGGSGTTAPVADVLPPVGRIGRVATWAVCALVTVQWAVLSWRSLDTGVYDFDSLNYHLPNAAEFFRSGWTTHILLTAPGGGGNFQPLDSELLHSVAMVAFGRDWLSPLLNLLWLALALLAAWALGRRAGRGPTTVTAVAIVLVSPLTAISQPGSAMSDTAVLALLLAMAVFLAEAWQQRAAGFALVLAGTAAGLAISSKVNAVPLVAAATVMVPVLAGARRRLVATATWVVPLVLTGSFWYLRNLVQVGNPVPTMHLGPLPVSHQGALQTYGYAVSSYLGNAHVIRHWFVPGLRNALGLMWPAVLVLTLAGVVAALRRGVAGWVRALAVVAAVGGIGYVVTPTTAMGPHGTPLLFAANFRYALPVIALALSLLPWVLPQRPRWQHGTLGVLGVVLVVTAFTRGPWRAFPTQLSRRSLEVAAVVLAVTAIGLLLAQRRPRWLLAAASAVLVLIAVAAGLPTSRHYVDSRYALREGGYTDTYRWARAVHDARIGITGFSAGYGLQGVDLTNVVRYVGDVGPHDSFSNYTDCASYLHALQAGHYQYVVVAPARRNAPAPAAMGWVAHAPGARLVFSSGEARVFRLDGSPDPTACSRDTSIVADRG